MEAHKDNFVSDGRTDDVHVALRRSTACGSGGGCGAASVLCPMSTHSAFEAPSQCHASLTGRTDGRTDRASGHSMQAVSWNVLLSLRVLSTISRERSDSAACDALSLTAINHSLSVFL